MHRSVADSHDLAPACLSQLRFSVTPHSALALESVDLSGAAAGDTQTGPPPGAAEHAISALQFL